MMTFVLLPMMSIFAHASWCRLKNKFKITYQENLDWLLGVKIILAIALIAALSCLKSSMLRLF